MRSLLRNSAPAGLSGLIAELTSGIACRRLPVSSIAFAYFGSVSGPPFDSIASGLLP